MAAAAAWLGQSCFLEGSADVEVGRTSEPVKKFLVLNHRCAMLQSLCGAPRDPDGKEQVFASPRTPHTRETHRVLHNEKEGGKR